MRRALFAIALFACGGSPAPPVVDAGDDAPLLDAPTDAPVRPADAVRLMAANITSGTKQSYEDPGVRIFQGLHPDVVLVQEFNYQAGTLRDLVDTAFGASFSFYVEPSGSIPNGIVSRYPILNAGSWVDASTTDRGFAWAYIDLPGPTDLFAVSLHLLTTSSTARDTEVKQVVSYVQANLPAGAYLVIGGDLNTESPSEPALADLASLVVFSPPFPADQNDDSNTSINRNHPHDWLLASPSLDAQKITAFVGTSLYPNGLVFDSRVYTPLSDVAPVLASDSAAPGMQHMPVARDFVVAP